MLISKDTTVDELLADPKAYGIPSFKEFCADPDKYRKRSSKSTVLDTIDNGGQNLKNYMTGVEYEIFGHTVKTAVEAERIANDHGYKKEDLEMKGEVQDQGGRKCTILFKLEPTVDAQIRVGLDKK